MTSSTHCGSWTPPVPEGAHPDGTWPSADERRQRALDMFDACHVAPSYRRLPHPTWTVCFSLLLDLLLGAGKSRYLCTYPTAKQQREVFVRGFSARSYSGICSLHLLWKLPYIEVRGKLGGIACPPELLNLIPSPKGQGLHLFHYTPDKLCCWQPSSRTIESLACLCTIVNNSIPELHDHFGKSEHSYGHWLELPMVEGEFHLWQVLQEYPAAADPASRDVTPLRLMSWLSCQLNEKSHTLIEEAMKEFSKVEPVHSDKILQMGQFHLPSIAGHLCTWDDLRDAIIDEISVRGRANPPQIVAALIKGFLQRLPLPRLLHVVDLVLPQMVLVNSPSQSSSVTFPGSQLVRDQWIAGEQCRPVKAINILVSRLFTSHAEIEHVTVNWNGNPALLFADMNSDEYASVWECQYAKAVTTLRQNVHMGLKKVTLSFFMSQLMVSSIRPSS